MALCAKRPRNWGKSEQQSALEAALKSNRVAYKVVDKVTTNNNQKQKTLWLAGSHKGVTLPFTESVADLVNVSRGQWEARHPFTGVVLAKGISLKDVIRATINNVWR